MPEETRPATTMFLPARTHADRNAAASPLRKPSCSSSSSELAPRRKRRIEQIGWPFEETGGIAAVIREPSGSRASTRGRDPVEPFAFDLFEQPLEEGAQLAVVGEADPGDAFDPLAGVAEDPAWAVDHPLLRFGVGEHLLGDRAEADQLVAQLARDRLERLLGRQPAVACELFRLRATERFLDHAGGAGAAVLARQVDLFSDERALDAGPDRLAAHCRHGSVTSSTSTTPAV